ncbi:MAG: hypothetical protein Q8O82_05585 [Pseudorhodobacter sp.]|nr:hypothetical protein [Pseudorhodobacter sp.]
MDIKRMCFTAEVGQNPDKVGTNQVAAKPDRHPKQRETPARWRAQPGLIALIWRYVQNIGKRDADPLLPFLI